MKQEQLDTSNGLLSIEDAHHKDNCPLVRKEAIDDTPFWLIQYEDKWFVVFGKYRITDEIPKTKDVDITPADALDYLDLYKWLIMTRLAGFMADALEEEKQKTK